MQNVYFCCTHRMKNLNILFCLLLSITLFSCNAEKKKLKERIAIAEKKSADQNVESLSALAALYEEYADKFKGDKEAPLYLLKSAKTYTQLQQFPKSIALFTLLTERYPNSQVAGDALNTIGYIYENNLGDYANAKKTYELFLQKYPNHVLAPDVRANLPLIGKTPDWVKELEGMDSVSKSQ